MNKYVYIILMLCMVVPGFAQDPAYPPAPAAVQNITAAEYYIDTDPGFGNGTSIIITPGTDINNISPVINVNGLINGTHRLYIRTRNALGIWSLTNVKEFLYDADIVYSAPPAAAQQVVAAEYFFDTDPGFGNGTAIAITPGLDMANVAVSTNTAALAQGTHRLYIRTRSQEGQWSMTNVKEFIVDFDFPYGSAPAAAQNVVAAEYFFDTDPGFGNGTAITITPGIDLADLPVAVNTNGLGIGTHRVYLRAKSQGGHWSMTNVKDFIVDSEIGYPTAPAPALNIVAAEYFIDTDPGMGNGTSIAITPGIDLADVPVTVNTNGLGLGSHRLYIRTRSQEGRWSLTSMKDFIVDSEIAYPAAPPAAQNVVAAEYFFDTDPGIGHGTAITVTPGVDVVDVAATVNTSALTNGEHTLYVRTRSQEGRWSLTNYARFSKGANASWTIDPATGHDYGTVAINTSNYVQFTIRNTGNVAVVLSNVQLSNPVFSTSFNAGASIPVGGSIALPVWFAPTASGSYSAQLKILSSTAGLDSVTTIVSGTAFTPGTPPVLTFAGVAPYNSTGVNPQAGVPGDYTYKVVYRSATNTPPQNGYPKIGIDRNGDQDFDDAGEGMYTMTQEGSSTDYITGITYSYTEPHPNVSNTLGYRFIARDNLGNMATTVNAGYISGPVVTFDQLDLKIFANDITFSKNNPLVNEPFTVTAVVTNSSTIPAVNVPVRFYRDTVFLESAVIPSIGALSSNSITRVFSFPTDGWYPIKVWIDSSNTLNDANPLNNYAIRPVTVGTVTLPGGIIVTTSSSLQACPQKLRITGKAEYFGVSSSTQVAGAEVTINTGSQIIKTTTDANGNYSFLLENPACGGAFTYTVQVTDFTFISNTATGNINITCPAPGACVVQPQPGLSVMSQFPSDPCGKTVGTSGTVQMTVTYRSRNLANMWCLWDQILKDTIKIYHNGTLIQTLWSVDGTTSPGEVKVIPVNVTLNATGPNVIEAKHTYIYNEFFQNMDNFYHGVMIPMSGYGSTTMLAESSNPDLTVKRYEQLTYTSFRVAVGNIKCGTAGSHIVRIYDSLPGGSYVLVKSDTIASIAPNAEHLVSYSDSTMAFGSHHIRVVVDAEYTVAEVNEDNNIFETSFTVPKPDLTVTLIEPVATGLAPGVPVRFRTTVKNTGTRALAFKVLFRVNGVQVGNKITVPRLDEKQTVTFTSDPFVVTSFDRDCPVNVVVDADIDHEIDESSESNNDKAIKLGSDVAPYMLPGELGSASNPVVVRINTVKTFQPFIRNIGNRNIMGVTVRFSLNGEWIGADSIFNIVAGEQFPSMGSFTRSFATPGNYVITVTADTANAICEISESNNQGTFHIRVVDANLDLEVLSQYISPSALNPNPGQTITLVGTVKNVGFKESQPNVMRFLVDDVQIGNDIPFNALLPGKDTTVQATATYSSLITGAKVMKIVVDPANALVEEREDNNEATRALIVGNAPDLARSRAGAISFNPQGFHAGDSVTVFYSIKNNGAVQGTAWVRFLIFDAGDALTAIDSIQVSLPSGGTMLVGKKMLFSIEQGMVITEIVNCSPMEFDLFNNNDTLSFSTVSPLKANTVVNSDLDMTQGLPNDLPGWIGGKLVLGNYDLIVHGQIRNFDTAHFVITNGTGRLRFVNTIAENVFPVGTSVYNTSFLKINNTGTADNFAVRVLPYVLKAGISGDTIRTGNVNRTWLIDEDVPGGSNATLEFTWNGADELPGFDRLVCKTAHFTGAWQFGNAGAALTDAVGRFVKSQSGYTSFSPFTVTSGGGTPLPLRLLQFAAVKQGSNAVLSWQTSEEVNTSHFEIEYSTDGRQFITIGRVTANNRPGINNYQFTHTTISEPVSYYRLKMADLDGNFTYSDVKMIRSTTATVLQVFPNPAKHTITVRGADAHGILQIVTADGRLMKQYVTRGGDMAIDVSTLPAGLYIIWYKNHDGQQQQLIMKE